MRTLTVVGLAESGAHLLCEDVENGEQFAVPGEQLRSAASAYRERQRDMLIRSRDTQEDAMPTPLSPREIQARIRLGESLDEVAAAAGCDPSKIEKFAYPVLMERSVMAERARSATVVVGGAPTKESVERLAARVLAARGQAAALAWDAHRTEDGERVLVLRWSAGHTENLARFSYHPAPSGGTVVALDDAAVGIVEPVPQPLHTVAEDAVEEPAVPRNPLLLAESPSDVAVQVHAPAETQPALPGAGTDSAGHPVHRAGNKVAAALAHHAVPAPSPAPAQVIPASLRGRADNARPAGKPAMPSWEDVLLGVRSSG